jgi:hypothetical protein
MNNIVPTWKNKVCSSIEEQDVVPVSSVGEVILTDEQLEAIYGGQKQGDDEHHHDNDGWKYHDNDGWDHHDYDGWYYYNHHWWKPSDHDKGHHYGH